MKRSCSLFFREKEFDEETGFYSDKNRLTGIFTIKQLLLRLVNLLINFNRNKNPVCPFLEINQNVWLFLYVLTYNCVRMRIRSMELLPFSRILNWSYNIQIIYAFRYQNDRSSHILSLSHLTKRNRFRNTLKKLFVCYI